jgi:DNA-binding protein HU-beta
MNKSELVAEMAKAAGISKAQAGKALDGALDGISKALRKSDKVTLVGFGTFSVMSRKARTGRNPRTGAPMKIRAKKVPKFTAGNKLKEAAAKARKSK